MLSDKKSGSKSNMVSLTRSPAPAGVGGSHVTFIIASDFHIFQWDRHTTNQYVTYAKYIAKSVAHVEIYSRHHENDVTADIIIRCGTSMKKPSRTSPQQLGHFVPVDIPNGRGA